MTAKGRFACIPVRTASAPDLSAGDLRVLIAIASHASSDGQAYPSLARIASLTGIARKNISRSVSALERAGLLRHRLRKSETGAWANSVYQIVFDDPPEVGLSNGSETTPPEISNGIPLDAQTIKKEGPRQPDEKSRQLADEMLAIWRAECGSVLSVPRSLDRDRVSACQARFRDSFGSDLEQWRSYCRRIIASQFCCGKSPSTWRADFDWALKPKSIRNVLEGKYQDGPPRRQSRNGTYDIFPLGPGGT